MRKTALLLLLHLTLSFSSVSHGEVEVKSFEKHYRASTSTPERPLQLTASVIDQKYCASNQLMMKLKLRYTNVGDRPLVLFKFGKVIFRYLVSRNVRDAEAERYKQDWGVMAYAVMDYKALDQASFDDFFITLKPGESFDIESNNVNIFINDGMSNSNSKFLSAGDYVLEVITSTWGGSPEQAERLRNRWKQRGDFWFGDVKSLPMSFKINEVRKLVNCLE